LKSPGIVVQNRKRKGEKGALFVAGRWLCGLLLLWSFY